MQYLQAINAIESTWRVYRKGCITYGEFITNIGSTVLAFEHEITRDDKPDNLTILSEHKEYRNLIAIASETLFKAN